LVQEIARPLDMSFLEVPSKLTDNHRYGKYFKGCIGATEKTHIPATTCVIWIEFEIK